MENFVLGMSFPSSFAVLLTIFTLTQAIPFPGPLPTVAYKAADITSRPTNAPHVTPEAAFGGYMANAAVCGWIGGNVSLPATCSSGSTCVYDSTNKIVGCCPLGGSCTGAIYTGCVDASSPPQTTFSPNIVTCYGQAVCYQNSYPDGYHQYGCGSPSDATTVETTFSGQNPLFTLEIVRTAITFPTSSSSFISTVQTSEPQSSSSQISSVSTTSTLTNSPGSSRNGSQVAITSTESEIPISGQGSQAQLGLIIGCIIGGIGALFALLAIGVYLMRRRQNSREPEVYLFPSVEKHSSSSSFASSRPSGHTRVGSSDSGATTSPINPFIYPNVYLNDLPALPEPQGEPEISPESPVHQHGRSNPYSAISIDDAAGLPSTWARPVAPPIPPRSLKRKPLPPLSRAVQYVNSHSDELEAGRQKTSLRPSNSICTVASSVYSRATDGHSYLERDNNAGWGRIEEEIPPLPQQTILKQNGVCLTNDLNVESSHLYAQSAPPTIERSPSPSFSWASEDSIFGWEVRLDEKSGRVKNIDQYHMEDEGDEKIMPLKLPLRPKNAVEKAGRRSVPILGDPKDLTPGERERRLYEV